MDHHIPLLMVCAFCGKSKDEVKRLIAGHNALICDECVELCNNILLRDSGIYDKSSEDRKRALPKPKDIYISSYILLYKFI